MRAFHGLALALLGIVLACGGCGYTLVRADALPPEIRTVAVEPADIGDGDPLLADALVRSLRTVMRRGGRLVPVGADQPADARLSIQVISDRSRPVAFDEFDDVLDYQSSLVADATLGPK